LLKASDFQIGVLGRTHDPLWPGPWWLRPWTNSCRLKLCFTI